jgi:hypothetical protein
MFNFGDLVRNALKGKKQEAIKKDNNLLAMLLGAEATLSQNAIKTITMKRNTVSGGLLKIYFRRSKHARWKDGLSVG